MSLSSLNPVEVQAVRTGLHLSIKEASEWIALHRSPRTWQRYENPDDGILIPSDIEEELYALSQIAEQLFEELHEDAFKAHRAGEVLELKYYRAAKGEKISSEWIAEHGDKHPVNWRIHQSVVSRIFREFGSSIQLV